MSNEAWKEQPISSSATQSQKIPNEEICTEQTLKRLVELLKSHPQQQPGMAQAAARVLAFTCTEPAHQAAACSAGAVPALAVRPL